MAGARRRRTVKTPPGAAVAVVHVRAMSRREFDAHRTPDILRYAEVNVAAPQAPGGDSGTAGGASGRRGLPA